MVLKPSLFCLLSLFVVKQKRNPLRRCLVQGMENRANSMCFAHLKEWCETFSFLLTFFFSVKKKVSYS